MPLHPTDLVIDVHIDRDDLVESLGADVRAGFAASPKDLPPRWFYDDRGSNLFDAITRLPEYYQTRAERSILLRVADEIATISGADTLVELGAGTAEKTRVLLAAMARQSVLARFVPFDVSEATLRATAAAIHEEYDIAVRGVVGDFDRHLDRIPRGGTRLIAFLGGTIGNLLPQRRAEFLSTIAKAMSSLDTFLVGIDLVKDTERLVSAYDDAAGVTAEFNRNVLHVINTELGADFDVMQFSHVARYNHQEERMEMWLRSLTDQIVKVRDLDLIVEFAANEEIRTETSAKFSPSRIKRELSDAGLHMVRLWTDDAGEFALCLARREFDPDHGDGVGPTT